MSRPQCGQRVGRQLAEPLEKRLLLSATSVAPSASATTVLAPLDTAEVGSFGLVGRRHGVALTAADPLSGAVVTFRLSGSGTGQVQQTSTGFDIVLTKTTASTTLRVTSTSTGRATIHSITDAGSLHGILAGSANLTGDVTVGKTLATFSVFDVNGPSHIVVSGRQQRTSYAFHDINSLSLDSASPIATLKAANWNEDGPVRGHLTAPFIGTMQISGTLEADVTATSSRNGNSIDNLLVGGIVEGGAIRAVLDIQRAILGALINSGLFAGVNSSVTGLPTSASQLSRAAGIHLLRVTGTSTTPFSVQNSNIAAHTLQTVVLGSIAAENGGTSFGLAAVQVGSYKHGSTGEDGRAGRKLTNLTQPGVPDAAHDFSLTIL